MTENKSPRKNICIIGAGSSGLVLMKELKSVGHDYTCFEMLPHIGGVYVKSYQNTILTTSSLLTAWSDHSDGNEKDPKFWTAEEYLAYLHNFAVKHELLRSIKFRYAVEEVRKDPSTGKWLVNVRGGRPVKGVERCGDFPEDENAQPETYEFDAVAVCTGTNNYSSLPHFEGQEKFKGEILHSEYYKNPDRFAGKKVLIIGSGESGSDITNEISKVADKVAISIRGKHGHLIPRIQGKGRVTDLNTNRLRYSNPHVFGDWIGYINQLAKRSLTSFYPQNDLTRVLQKIGELNMQQKTSAFSKFGCKNEGFVTAMVLRGAELHRDKFYLTEDRAIFEDGSEFQCDYVVACTGYRNAFPFFDKHHPELCCAGMNPRKNYKQIFAVDYPTGEIAFFGFARPAFGSIPPTVEMQSRFYAMVINNEIKLPSKEKMQEVALEDQRNWEHRFRYDAERVKGLVDYQVYCDMLAKEMDVMPPLSELALSKPWLWFKIMFGPFTVHQYRLRGPHADPKRAEEVYARQPVGDVLESTITASFLITAKILSKLGFSRFNPNE